MRADDNPCSEQTGTHCDYLCSKATTLTTPPLCDPDYKSAQPGKTHSMTVLLVHLFPSSGQSLQSGEISVDKVRGLNSSYRSIVD